MDFYAFLDESDDETIFLPQPLSPIKKKWYDFISLIKLKLK